MIVIMKFENANCAANYNQATKYSSIDEIKAIHKRYVLKHRDSLVRADVHQKELANMTILIFEWKHSGYLNRKKRRLQRAVYCIIRE